MYDAVMKNKIRESKVVEEVCLEKIINRFKISVLSKNTVELIIPKFG